MTQLRSDAAYIRTRSHERSNAAHPAQLDRFDEQVCDVLRTAHTVRSAAKTLASSGNETAAADADWETRVTHSMQRLLQAERIQLSPDS